MEIPNFSRKKIKSKRTPQIVIFIFKIIKYKLYFS